MTRREKPAGLAERNMTVRRTIATLLSDHPLSAKQISAAAGIPEKEVYGHIPHIGKTLAREGRRLAVTPAECRKCGFVFRKRERPERPGKCPVCRGESITDPLFAVG